MKRLMLALMLCAASACGQTMVDSVAYCASFAGCGLSRAMNNTGATLLAVAVSTYNSAAPADGSWIVTSPNAGTWTCISSPGPTHVFSNLCYILNPTVSSSQTVTFSSGAQVAGSAISFSGVTGIITSTKANNNTTSVQPGTITPSGTVLFLTSYAFSNNPVTACSVNSGFTYQACLNGGTLLNASLGYLSSSSAQNPTWSVTSSSVTGSATVMATFSVAAAGPPNSQSYVF